MSVSVVLIPVVAASWPTIVPALTATAAALGYSISKAVGEAGSKASGQHAETSAEVAVKNASVLGEELGAGQSMTMERDGVTLRFTVDGSGRCKVVVSGPGKSKAELAKIGEVAANKVVQMYTYNRLMSQAKSQGFDVVEEQVDEQGALRIRLRRS